MSTTDMDGRHETAERVQSVQSKTKQRIGLFGLYVRSLVNHPCRHNRRDQSLTHLLNVDGNGSPSS